MRLAVLTASTCGTMIAITLANLIAVPAIQMGCPEDMTGKVMSLALSASMCAQPSDRSHTAGRTASTRRARSWR